MKIIWHGQSLFEIVTGTKENGEVNIIIDPFDGKLGLKVPKMKADILLTTHQHYDHCNVKDVGGNPFLIEGPGEYEVKGVHIKGIPAFHDNSSGEERGQVTLYTIEAEEIKICHLSDIGQKELTDQQMEEIGEVNILMIPVGSVYTIDAKGASDIINQIEPQIVIPMHYKITGLKEKLEGIDKFLKVMGTKEPECLNKLSLRRKDLSEDATKIIILKP